MLGRSESSQGAPQSTISDDLGELEESLDSIIARPRVSIRFQRIRDSMVSVKVRRPARQTFRARLTRFVRQGCGHNGC